MHRLLARRHALEYGLSGGCRVALAQEVADCEKRGRVHDLCGVNRLRLLCLRPCLPQHFRHGNRLIVEPAVKLALVGLQLGFEALQTSVKTRILLPKRLDQRLILLLRAHQPSDEHCEGRAGHLLVSHHGKNHALFTIES